MSTSLQQHALFKTGYFAAGQWHNASATFDVTNPATGEVLAKVARAGKAETERAIAAAQQAFPAWRDKTAKQRAEILNRWYQLIIENKSWLGQLMTAEQGKTPERSRRRSRVRRQLYQCCRAS
jgi:NAD-dependent aldehyde dehydrogenases